MCGGVLGDLLSAEEAFGVCLALFASALDYL